MKPVRLSQRYVFVRGLKLVYRGSDTEGQVFVHTEDSRIATELGLTRHQSDGYMGWIAEALVEEFAEEVSGGAN